MKRVIALLISFVFIIAIAEFVSIPDILRSPYKAEVVETWQSANTPFNIRINKHIERGGFAGALNGAYYDYQSNSTSGRK